MKLSTEHYHLQERIGDERAITQLKEAGFDAIDMSLFCMSQDDNIFNTSDYRRYAKELRAHADALGIPFNQSHACFGFDFTNVAAFTEQFYPKQVRALEIAGILGCHAVVIHPLHGPMSYRGHEEELFEINMKFYRSLLPYAKEYGVKIALENMWQRDQKRKGIIVDSTCSQAGEFIRYLDTLNDEHFVACLDIGHCALVGDDPADTIRALGRERLQALHVHDNDFLNDQHTFPYLGKYNWEEIIKALAEIDYQGDLTMESDGLYHSLPIPLLPAADRFLVAIGRYLIERYEFYRKNA